MRLKGKNALGLVLHHSLMVIYELVVDAVAVVGDAVVASVDVVHTSFDLARFGLQYLTE